MSWLKVMFWNVRKAVSPKVIALAAQEHAPDIIVLAESTEPIVELSSALNHRGGAQYYVPPGLPPDVRRQLRILARFTPDTLKPVYDGHGISALRIETGVFPPLTLIAVHLRSKLNIDPEDQTLAATEIREQVEDVESRVGDSRTVVVGDFNMNPFERGVVSSNGFHAVMSRQIAKRDFRTVANVSRKFLYNPMWTHFGERRGRPPGTYYYDNSARTTYFWNIFDQVLLRPELLDDFDDGSVTVLTQIGESSLLKDDGQPDEVNFSDHLPLLFKLSVEQKELHG